MLGALPVPGATTEGAAEGLPCPPASPGLLAPALPTVRAMVWPAVLGVATGEVAAGEAWGG
ncbi:hypothetical protein [Actinomyces lilanjuaniae]|uniref:hypothetical protein n=1 Tax=Actinomyces lilanjuaniae TaxID=2321394 RepID=UPI0013C50D91|nr:hypothetical protein [Actinomyces lilanjuaniae]